MLYINHINEIKLYDRNNHAIART